MQGCPLRLSVSVWRRCLNSAQILEAVWFCLSPSDRPVCLGLAGLLNRASVPVLPRGYSRPKSPHIPRENDPKGAIFLQVNFYKPPEKLRKHRADLIPLQLLRLTRWQQRKWYGQIDIPFTVQAALGSAASPKWLFCKTRDKIEPLLIWRVPSPMIASLIANKKSCLIGYLLLASTILSIRTCLNLFNLQDNLKRQDYYYYSDFTNGEIET